MSNYEGLAKIYDFMMSGVDYEGWADYILKAAGRFGDHPHTVLDLACGTGSTTLPLAKRGLKATGLDLSGAMLKIAAEKAAKADLDVDFKEANMLNLDFEQPFDLIVSFQDGINYLTGEEDFERLAAAVDGCLVPGGLFMFDLNRVDHYSDSDTTVAELDDMTLIYENQYDEQRRIWHIHLIGFVKEGELYRKFDEVHEENNHDLNDVSRSLNTHHMEIVKVWKMFYEDDATAETNRVFVIAKKTGA